AIRITNILSGQIADNIITQNTSGSNGDACALYVDPIHFDSAFGITAVRNLNVLRNRTYKWGMRSTLSGHAALIQFEAQNGGTSDYLSNIQLADNHFMEPILTGGLLLATRDPSVLPEITSADNKFFRA